MPGHAPNWLLGKIAKKRRQERNQSFTEDYQPQAGDRLYLWLSCDYIRILLRKQDWKYERVVYSDAHRRPCRLSRVVMIYFSSLEKLMACGDEETRRWAESMIAKTAEWRISVE